MPCDVVRDMNKENQVRALDRLRRALGAGSASVVRSASGEITFRGWVEKGDWCDGCAYRTLAAEGSAELRRALARAEAMGNGATSRIARGMER